jgi:hypothetical protein
VCDLTKTMVGAEVLHREVNRELAATTLYRVFLLGYKITHVSLPPILKEV